MTKTKIEWCDMTWNPVWGCENNCPYCYARKIAKRFYLSIYKTELSFSQDPVKTTRIVESLQHFKPTWLESNYNKPFPKKTSRIFVNSMSDISSWKSEWTKRVIEKIKDHPQHQFLFLTKNQRQYNKYPTSQILNMKNCWIGMSITGEDKNDNQAFEIYELNGEKNVFISIEPFHENLSPDVYFTMGDIANWIIIGSETGNRRGKKLPEKKWISEIVDLCKSNKIPVFLKNSLQDIWGEKLIQEFPEKI